MRVLKPSYYDKFECIADKCKDSCCMGWTISIDKDSYNKYKKVKGEFGKKLNSGISRDRRNNNLFLYGKMNLTKDKICSFLDEDRLCSIYKKLGPEYLCNTCQIYPRDNNKYGDIVERNLLLSCPEVTKLLIDTKEKLCFIMEEEKLTGSDLKNIQDRKFDKKAYDFFWKVRAFFIEIAQFSEIELWKRLSLIKFCQEKFQYLIDNGQYNQVDDLIERLSISITDEKFISSLDNLKSVDEVKGLFISSIIRLRTVFGIDNEEFMSVLSDFGQLLDKNIDNQIQVVKEIETKFNAYFKDKEYILENFLVYKLYKNIMDGISKKDLSEAILKIMVEFSVLKKLLVVRWDKYKEEFNMTHIIDVIYSFCRTIEHNEKYMKRLCDNIKNAGYDTTAYLTILVR